jgi:hypothetical protein
MRPDLISASGTNQWWRAIMALNLIILTKKLHVVVRKRAWSLVVINGT